MSITLALGAAISGLQTSQKGLDSVSRNIVNVNTDGYTRKVFLQESQILAGRGVGVRAAGLVRNVDESLLKDIRREAAVAGALNSQQTYYARIQDTFGTPEDNTSISHAISELGKSFEALGVDVSSLTQAMNTVQSGQDIADQFKRMTEMVQDLRLEADRAIEADVLKVNNLLSQIDTLNAEIIRNENTFLDTGDLKDQRDQALTALSDLMDITYFTRDSGEVIILTTSGRSLLDKSPATLSHQAVTQTSSELTYDGGNFNPLSLDGFDITRQTTKGAIGGYLDMRDSVLPAIQSELDELSVRMKEALNQAHNRGTSYPDLAQEFNGTRRFIDSGNQTINIAGGGDVKFVLYNEDGTQAAASSLVTEWTGATSGSIDSVVSALNNFFGSYKGSAVTWASVDSEGQLNIDIPSTETIGFAMRDETSTGEPGDITIQYDADSSGGGIYEETVSGFSNFFGLNDFFTNAGKNDLYDSDIVSPNWKANTTSGITIGVEGAPSIATVAISPEDTISSIVSKINNDPALQAQNIKASVEYEGSGVRLRILQNDGKEMVVSESTSAGVLSRIGVKPSKAGAAHDLTVRQDLKSDSARLSRGILQRNDDTGQYILASGDNTVANQMAAVFTSTVDFGEAGKLSAGSLTLSEYASSILSQSSTAANRNQTQLLTQTTLTQSLALKQGEVSGVNLDEELSQLMIYQQAYTAAARVITTTQTLFDVLNNVIR